jgi:hypothetical protein
VSEGAIENFFRLESLEKQDVCVRQQHASHVLCLHFGSKSTLLVFVHTKVKLQDESIFSYTTLHEVGIVTKTRCCSCIEP